MGAQLYRMPAKHAANHSGPRVPPHAAGGRTAQYPDDSRHDRASASSGRNSRAGISMEHTLSNLKPPRGSRHRKVRVGRGMGSKMGKTSGAGNKGQQSRRGYSRRPGFEGGQMPLHRRLPKRGFSSPFPKTYAVVNVETLNTFPAGETVTPELLSGAGIIRARHDGVKILGDGVLKVALTVRAHSFSKSAQEK